MLKALERLWRQLTGRRRRRRRRRRPSDLEHHLATASAPTPSPPKKRLRKRRARVRRTTTPELRFSHEEPWSWSLKVLEGHRVVGLLHASTPVSCLEVVATRFAGGGEPVEPYRMLITCNANHRQLKLDRHVWRHLAEADDDTILAFFGDHFGRDLSGLAERSSVTVMIDDHHEVVDASALLDRVFGHH